LPIHGERQALASFAGNCAAIPARNARLMRGTVWAGARDVMTEYFNAYSHFICDNEPPTCTESMIIPPPYEQLQIVLNLSHIATSVNLDGLEGIVMKLLIAGETDAVDTLVKHLGAVNDSNAVIRAIVEFANHLPINLPIVSL
jgi:hypothetical protein